MLKVEVWRSLIQYGTYYVPKCEEPIEEYPDSSVTIHWAPPEVEERGIYSVTRVNQEDIVLPDNEEAWESSEFGDPDEELSEEF